MHAGLYARIKFRRTSVESHELIYVHTVILENVVLPVSMGASILHDYERNVYDPISSDTWEYLLLLFICRFIHQVERNNTR